jgi:5-methylcytosine-specific restriction enzyme A
METVPQDGDELPANVSLIEMRRYRLHSRIERNPAAAKAAKQHHGLRCQVCDVSFAERYGPLGDGFIEAHHLRPISLLEEGKPVSYDVATDFAVLCANCHRMIHRAADPSDIDGFRALFRLRNNDALLSS